MMNQDIPAELYDLALQNLGAVMDAAEGRKNFHEEAEALYPGKYSDETLIVAWQEAAKFSLQKLEALEKAAAEFDAAWMMFGITDAMERRVRALTRKLAQREGEAVALRVVAGSAVDGE
jgi:hypothetical protein